MAKANWTLIRGEHDRSGHALFFVRDGACAAAGVRAPAAGDESFATD
jgi:hypothetical protein